MSGSSNETNVRIDVSPKACHQLVSLNCGSQPGSFFINDEATEEDVDAVLEDLSHDLEAITEYVTSSVYDATNRFDELLQNENGTVSFISEKIRQRVVEVVERTTVVVDVQAAIIEDVINIDHRDLEYAGRACHQ